MTGQPGRHRAPGPYLKPTIDAALKQVRASLKRARARYAHLQAPGSDYGQDMCSYIVILEAVERVWVEARKEQP